MSRTVSLTKPHLFMSPYRTWWCLQTGTRIGAGYTAKAAYDDWLYKSLRA